MSTASAVQPAMAYPWLRPATASLLALTEDSPDATALRDDPGMIAHILRYSRPTPDPMTFALTEAALCQPGLCETAAQLLEHPDTGVRDRQSEIDGQRIASLASRLAAETGLCSPDAAWAVGLLAPLNRYLGPADKSLSSARRHLARWRMPLWIQAAVGYLDLPIEETLGLGGHRGVNRVLRAALRATGCRLLSIPAESDGDLDPLGRSLSTTPTVFREIPQGPEPALLRRLLKATAQARGRTAQSWMLPLEERIDVLVAQLGEARGDFDHQLRDAKLGALAEFAAGASHEINNPLAVISGNAQWLRGREPDPEKAQHLQTILRQTQRIHELLTGTRQFARPSAAKAGVHSTESLVVRAFRDAEVEADALGVKLEMERIADSPLHADGEQIRTALGHLINNALAAAGSGGWVKLSSTIRGETVAIHVDDGGSGPDVESQDHLFDPFYSGRSAGRGRGLGLPIAWALARNNGGDIRWAGPDSDCTRFTLNLPKSLALQDASPRQVA